MQAFDEFYNELVKSVAKQVEQNILNKINLQPVMDKPLTPEKVAEFLQVDKTTVYRMCKEGQLKSIKVGSIHSRKPHLRIKQSDLNDWIDKSRDNQFN